MTTSSKLRQSHQRKFGFQHDNKAHRYYISFVKTSYVSLFFEILTDINIADVLTKPTTKEKLAFCTLKWA